MNEIGLVVFLFGFQRHQPSISILRVYLFIYLLYKCTCVVDVAVAAAVAADGE